MEKETDSLVHLLLYISFGQVIEDLNISVLIYSNVPRDNRSPHFLAIDCDVFLLSNAILFLIMSCEYLPTMSVY